MDDRAVCGRGGGRDYEVRTEDSGDYYDVEPVVAEINGALEDAGADGRYAPAGDAGQIVFGTPESIGAFSRRTGIVFQLGEDPPDGEDTDDAVLEDPEPGLFGRLKRWFS